jgi:hypothetical protein
MNPERILDLLIDHACDALRYVALNKLAVSNSGKYLVV